MTNKEARAPGPEYFFDCGMEDYIAARCCLINGLMSSYTLASFAVEKILKYCLVLKGMDISEVEKIGHDLQDLSIGSAIFRGDDFRIHSDFIVNLNNVYQAFRYPNKPGKFLAHHRIKLNTSNDLSKLDDLIIYLIKGLPSPCPYFYISRIMQVIFSSSVNKVYSLKRWFAERNEAFKRNSFELEKRFNDERRNISGI